ncbi:globin C, coelomic-like [Hetaerina americana]|uniref:globin C, coelomic-like n=1 Tax=Hetaerina americana TaxID=62018 RepID=UPI003A7F1AE2
MPASGRGNSLKDRRSGGLEENIATVDWNQRRLLRKANVRQRKYKAAKMGAAASAIAGWLVPSWRRAPASGDEGPTPPEDQGPPDDVTGLTTAQVDAVRRTFEFARSNIKAFGVDLFVELFSAYPDYQKLFKSFASVPLNQLSENKKFIAHSTTVVYSIINVVDNLDDAECLVELLFKIGSNHARRNVEHEAFQNLNNVIIVTLKKKLGKKFTSFAEESWRKTLDVAISVIFKGMDEGKLEAQSS